MHKLIEEIEDIINSDEGAQDAPSASEGDDHSGAGGECEKGEGEGSGDSREGDGSNVEEDREKLERLGKIAQIREIVSGDICESKAGFNPAVIELISKKVSRNDITGALMLGAKMLGAKKLEKKFDLISKLHDIDGSMDSDLMKYRMTASKELDAIAKRDLSDDEFKSFNRAF
jgi:hypothetical protein